jgi:undecaprenyl-diphosphatase
MPPATPKVERAPFGSAMAIVIVGIFGLIASLVVLGSVAADVRDQEVFALDTWATPFLHGIASPSLDAVMNWLTWMGSSAVIVPAFAVVAVLLLWRRRPGAAIFLAVACAGALVLNVAMKVFFQRPRPSLPWASVLPDYSFPSGHTMNAVVFYLALSLIVWSILGRRVGLLAMAVAAVLALGVGISRIYLGYHYLTDVVGGILAGIAWLLVVGTALRARPAWRQWRVPRTPGRDPTPETRRAAKR